MSENKNEWLDSAKCVGNTRMFYDDVEQEDGYNEEGLAVARRLCDSCPVRGRCFAEAIQDENHRSVNERYGVRAGLTPQQRHSAVLRKTVHCPKCDSVLDPAKVREGILVCPVNRRHLNRTTVPIPNEGDGWSKRHLTLARRILRYMNEHPRQRNMPSIQGLADELGERWHDVKRVYEAFLVDGTLTKNAAGKYVRRSGSKRTDPDKWLPPHLVN